MSEIDGSTMNHTHNRLREEVTRLNAELSRLATEDPDNHARRAAVVVAMRVTEDALRFTAPLVLVPDADLESHPAAASARVNLGRLAMVDDPAEGFVRAGVLFDHSVNPPEDLLATTRAICADAIDVLEPTVSPGHDGIDGF